MGLIYRICSSIFFYRFVLESGLCNMPKNYGLWKTVRLAPPDTPIKDLKNCYHGVTKDHHYGNISADTCKWMHFRPTTTRKELMKAYSAITLMGRS